MGKFSFLSIMIHAVAAYHGVTRAVAMAAGVSPWCCTITDVIIWEAERDAVHHMVPMAECVGENAVFYQLGRFIDMYILFNMSSSSQERYLWAEHEQKLGVEYLDMYLLHMYKNL